MRKGKVEATRTAFSSFVVKNSVQNPQRPKNDHGRREWEKKKQKAELRSMTAFLCIPWQYDAYVRSVRHQRVFSWITNGTFIFTSSVRLVYDCCITTWIFLSFVSIAIAVGNALTRSFRIRNRPVYSELDSNQKGPNSLPQFNLRWNQSHRLKRLRENVLCLSSLGVFHRLDRESTCVSQFHSITQGISEASLRSKYRKGGSRDCKEIFLCQGKSLCLSTRGGNGKDLSGGSRCSNRSRTEISGWSGLEEKRYFCCIWLRLPWGVSVLVNGQQGKHNTLFVLRHCPLPLWRNLYLSLYSLLLNLSSIITTLSVPTMVSVSTLDSLMVDFLLRSMRGRLAHQQND